MVQVLGGMTTFLFVNIVTSGLSILGPVMTNRRSRLDTSTVPFALEDPKPMH